MYHSTLGLRVIKKKKKKSANLIVFIGVFEDSEADDQPQRIPERVSRHLCE